LTSVPAPSGRRRRSGQLSCGSPRGASRRSIQDHARFAEVVRRAFGQRRKTLRNALAGLVDEAAIRAAGCDPGARAETA
jgi:16S rRNA (adenine1518-N6/adenine1519-N6)-dimethyltransferase